MGWRLRFGSQKTLGLGATWVPCKGALPLPQATKHLLRRCQNKLVERLCACYNVLDAGEDCRARAHVDPMQWLGVEEGLQGQTSYGRHVPNQLCCCDMSEAYRMCAIDSRGLLGGWLSCLLRTWTPIHTYVLHLLHVLHVLHVLQHQDQGYRVDVQAGMGQGIQQRVHLKGVHRPCARVQRGGVDWAAMAPNTLSAPDLRHSVLLMCCAE